MALPASAFPVETPPSFLGVSHSATGKVWRDRLDARGAARALAITQRYKLPEMLARVLAGRGVGPEQVVAVVMDRSAELIVALLDSPLAAVSGANIPLFSNA